MSLSISVLLPFFNAESTIVECVQSILNQSFHDFEILAVDDHSTDRSVDIVRDLAVSDSRIRILENSGRGIVDALNCGMSNARGQHIARMDADDIMHRERLEAQLEYFKRDPVAVLVSSLVRIFPEELVSGGYRKYEEWLNGCVTPEDIAEEIFVESPLAHPSVMFRRETIMRLGGYRQGHFPEDYDLWLRIHQAGFRMIKIPRILLHWREGEGRLSRVDARYSRKAMDALRAEYLACDKRLLKTREEKRELVFWGAGRRTRARVNLLLKKDFSVSAWIDVDPKKIGKTFFDACVHPPEWLSKSSRPFVLSYVTNHGARQEIARYLDDAGYLRGKDYLMVGQ